MRAGQAWTFIRIYQVSAFKRRSQGVGGWRVRQDSNLRPSD